MTVYCATRFEIGNFVPRQTIGLKKMKVASSLKTLKSRDRNCQVVRRRGRLYVINKKNPRFKARQG